MQKQSEEWHFQLIMGIELLNKLYKIILLVFIFSSTEAKDKYSIFISVNDLNGQPIKNAKTRLLNESGKKIANTKSNKSGKATLKKIKAGDYTLIVEDKKLGSSEIEIEILDEDKVITISIPLGEKLIEAGKNESSNNQLNEDPLPEGVFIVSGKIIDNNGAGIKKAEIRLKNENGKRISSTKSKKNGTFELKKIPSGYYIVEASKKNTGTGYDRIKIWGSNKEVQITIPSELPPKEKINKLSDTLKETEELVVVDSLPQQRESKPKPKLEFDNLFFQYESNLKALQSEIDSLKTVVMAYDQQQKMPSISREILDAINLPNFHHRIELQNGTVVLGNIEEESDSSLTLSTQIGRLVLEKQMVVRMDEHKLPAANVTFLGDPFIDYYPDRQQFSGRIKNIGEKRADFVRVVGNLFDQTTSIAGIDSIFIKGTRVVYNSNVITDTALDPGQTATYKLIIPIEKGKKAQYHTMEIHWEEVK